MKSIGVADLAVVRNEALFAYGEYALINQPNDRIEGRSPSFACRHKVAETAPAG